MDIKRKKLSMDYYNLGYGTIDFYLITNYTNSNKKVELTFWNTWDNFDEYIIWMENVLKGNNNCIYEHRPEDVPFYFEYKDNTFLVYTWQDVIENYLININIEKDELIYELYYSFKNFINSDKYDYKLWEYVTFGDILEIKYGNKENGINNMLKMTWKNIIELLNENSEEKDYQINEFDNIIDWNNCNNNDKINFIKEYLLENGMYFQDGKNLRKMKSEYIENYFKEPLKT
jgi:hypothetical protein